MVFMALLPVIQKTAHALSWPIATTVFSTSEAGFYAAVSHIEMEPYFRPPTTLESHLLHICFPHSMAGFMCILRKTCFLDSLRPLESKSVM